ncbi:MAG TPA: MBL fold metallo-hydrolase [Crocinitomicaceae bacterium]|nr:MBL fold metallo-hydrolase [Crocinitomicaceae bacterium]
MKIEQIFTSCLAEMAYYIESNGEAVIIDPLRETAPYTERADNDNAKIKYIFLTHFHADFVSGHVDLAKKTGATIVYGPGATAEYELYNGSHGEIFNVGDITLEMLHTPGHTMESSSLLLRDENGKEQCLFSGDALFIGDVGRPDLAIKQGELTEEDLAKHLFNTLRNVIMPLPDDIIVYPNHGAGSACGKNMSKETYDTLGHQKEVNYALRADMTEDEFVKEVLTGLVAPPQYFPKNAGMNKGINMEIDDVVARGTKELSVDEFKSLVADGALILDTRHQTEFVKAHIPGSIFIGLAGGFAPWVGALIEDINQKIVLVTDFGKEEEAVTRLSRIGYDNSLGILPNAITAWSETGNKLASIDQVTPEELANLSGVNILDVRKESEYYSERVIDAINQPLDTINKTIAEMDKDKTYYVHCAGGYRSVIFNSIAKANGIHNLIDVAGGFGAMKNVPAFNMSEYACPTTML